MNRREFLKGAAWTGATALAGGCATVCGGEGFDDHLSVFISDLHIGGVQHELDYTQPRLQKTIDAILAMRPLPRRVVCFGDIAMSWGLAEDYAVSKPMLKRLESAGIELHLTLGNHDRRSCFFREWPEYLEKPAVPGRCTRVVDLGGCDLVLLDTLKGADDRDLRDMGPVEGTIDDAQLAWFEKFVVEAKRPFFVGSHQYRDLYVEGETPTRRAAKSPYFAGWIYGHDHAWCTDIAVGSWKNNVVVPILALPSTGLWGDIGYVTFRTDAAGATASLFQDEFFFQTPAAYKARPAWWDVRTKENNGRKTRFAFGFAKPAKV